MNQDHLDITNAELVNYSNFVQGNYVGGYIGGQPKQVFSGISGEISHQGGRRIKIPDFMGKEMIVDMPQEYPFSSYETAIISENDAYTLNKLVAETEDFIKEYQRQYGVHRNERKDFYNAHITKYWTNMAKWHNAELIKRLSEVIAAGENGTSTGTGTDTGTDTGTSTDTGTGEDGLPDLPPADTKKKFLGMPQGVGIAVTTVGSLALIGGIIFAVTRKKGSK